MERRERLLVVALRAGAAVMMVALVAVVMPRCWMAWAHERMGLGRFPEQPITEYLARSLSGAYALVGAFCWIFAGDVGRYRTCICFMAWVCMLGGLGLCLLDWKLGMPLLWTVGDGFFPPVYGGLLLVLLRGGQCSVTPEQASTGRQV